MRQLLIVLLISSSAFAQPGIKPHAHQFLIDNNRTYTFLDISRIGVSEKKVVVDVFKADSTHQSMNSGPSAYHGTYKKLFLAIKNHPEFYVIHMKNEAGEDIYLYIETPGRNELVNHFFFEKVAISEFKFEKGTYVITLFDEDKDNYEQLLKNVKTKETGIPDTTYRLKMATEHPDKLYSTKDLFLGYYDVLYPNQLIPQTIVILPKTLKDCKVSDTPLSIFDVLTQRFNQTEISALKKLLFHCGDSTYNCNGIEIYYHQSVIN